MFALDHPKLARLAEIEGYPDPLDLIQDAVFDSMCPAICSNDGCEATSDMEPDQDHGYCENCGTQTMQSALIIAGMI